MRTWGSLVCLALCLLLAPRGEAQQALVIQGARIVTGSGLVIARGNVVVRGERIEAVGPDAAIPPGAQMVDGTGLTVYPGLLDAYCLAGVAAPPAAPQPAQQQGGSRPGSRRGGQGTGGMTAPPPPAPLVWRKATDGFNTKSEALAALRANGYTTALFGTRGILTPGEDVLMALTPGEIPAMLLQDRAAVNVNTLARGFTAYPSTLMGAFAFLRQAFYDSLDSLNHPPSKPDPRLEALAEAASGKIPVFYAAQTESDMRRALKLAAEFRLRLLVLGGREAEKMASPLASGKAAVILTDDWTPALALAKAGVPFALASNSFEMSASEADELRTKALALAEKGLPVETLLAALTRVPAELLGVADRIGTLAPGRLANLTVSQGDLFAKEGKIRFVVIRGQKLDPTPVTAKAGLKPAPLPEDGVTYANVDHDDADEDGEGGDR